MCSRSHTWTLSGGCLPAERKRFTRFPATRFDRAASSRRKLLADSLATAHVVRLDLICEIDSKRYFVAADINHGQDLIFELDRFSHRKFKARLTHEGLLA